MDSNFLGHVGPQARLNMGHGLGLSTNERDIWISIVTGPQARV